MNTLIFASEAGLWATVATLIVTVFALARQIGLLHKRIIPVGARMTNEGPQVNDVAPELSADDVFGKPVRLASDGRMTMLLFVSPSCSTCKSLVSSVKTMWRSERDLITFVLVSTNQDLSLNQSYVADSKLGDIPLVMSKQLAELYKVSAPPFAVLVGSDHIVKSKGVVNHFEHLESLVNTARLGYRSAEEFHREHGIGQAHARAESSMAVPTGAAQ